MTDAIPERPTPLRELIHLLRLFTLWLVASLALTGQALGLEVGAETGPLGTIATNVPQVYAGTSSTTAGSALGLFLEQSLALKRDSNLCVEIGEYCSQSTPIVHICTQHTRTYCCFDSQLAEEINVQGKAQLGISMGSPQNPNCGGRTVAQFQSINMSTMNLSGFQSEISPYGVDNSQATSQALGAGASSAQPVP